MVSSIANVCDGLSFRLMCVRWDKYIANKMTYEDCYPLGSFPTKIRHLVLYYGKQIPFIYSLFFW